jgi:hypothetical protein
MKVFLPNSEVDDRVTKLIRSFRKQMNGETAEQMEKRGIYYKLNYGIGLVTLREKAKSLPGDSELADRLWHRSIRETMILASLIIPKEEMTYERGVEWSTLINNCELVEQAALNIFGKTTSAERLVEEWFGDESLYLRALAFYTLGWMFRFGEVSDALLRKGLDSANIQPGADVFCLYRGVSHFIRQMLRINPEVKNECKSLVELYEQSDDKNLNWLASEIKEEIEFL